MSGGFAAATVYKFTGTGIIFAAIYDTWTNFGVFLLTYNHTLENLILVYILGLPFMLYHLISSLITFTLIGFPFYIISLYGIDNNLNMDDESINHEQN